MTVPDPIDVLLIDDDPAVRRLLGRLFARLPFSHRLVGDAAEAFAALAERPARLLLLDGQLGTERAEPFIERFRAASPGIVVVGISGVNTSGRTAGAAPYDGLAVKPVLLGELKELLEQWLPR